MEKNHTILKYQGNDSSCFNSSCVVCVVNQNYHSTSKNTRFDEISNEPSNREF